MNIFNTSCPVVKIGRESLVEWIAVAGERRPVEFEKEIFWLQKSESCIQLLHGGELLKECGTYNDFFGYLTSVNQTESEKVLANFSITPESTLELVVRATVFQEPCFETRDTIAHNRAKHANHKSQYAYIPDKWCKEIIRDGEKVYPRLERVVLDDGVVWSSKNTPEQNAQLSDKFKARWQTDSLIV